MDGGGKPFKFTEKQDEALTILSGAATHVMLFGGSRSGKTFLLVWAVVMRALKAPNSRHAILRFRFNHVKASIILDTFPKVMALCFPDQVYHLDKTDWYATFGNGSQIWFGGLDDKERTEKILGQEHATIYLNECSQIPHLAREMAVTRLAQLAEQDAQNGELGPLKLRMFYDCNPPTKSHWTYRLFVLGVDPESKKALPNADDFVCFQINPKDNEENLAPGYIKTLESLSGRMQRRFLIGEFGDATPGALFQEEWIDRHRVTDQKLPDMVRIVVAVDPSGSGDEENADNDEIGIAVAGLGVDGHGYLLEDCSVKAGPATWGKVVTNAFERHEANTVVGEQNFGGEMVRHTIQVARPRTPYKAVTASRGKMVRAEPVSALYEEGRIHHVGYHPELEDELSAFSTSGYLGTGSPNRGDAAVWAFTELFAGIVAPKKKTRTVKPWGPSARGVGL